MTQQQTSASRVQGFFFAAGSSQRRPAFLAVTGAWAELHDAATGEILSRAPHKLLQIDAPIGTAPRKVTFPNEDLFESGDHAGIESLTGASRGSLLHRYEAFGPRLVAVLGVCLAGAWAIWRYGLDMLVAVAIWATPPAVLTQMDKGTLQVIDLSIADDTRLSLPQQQKAREIHADLLAALPPDVAARHEFTLLFRDMPSIGPNAFALPGGTMILTDDFLHEFPQPDVLAGVLGHEIGHVVAQHGIKRLYRSVGSAVLIAFLAGDVGPILEDIVLEGNVLLSLSHSRAQERDADAFGVKLAAQAGYSPSGLVTFFSRIAEIQGQYDEGMEWMSTHPLNDARVRQIETYIQNLPR